MLSMLSMLSSKGVVVQRGRRPKGLSSKGSLVDGCWLGLRGCRPRGLSMVVDVRGNHVEKKTSLKTGGQPVLGWEGKKGGEEGAFYTRISKCPTRPFGIWPTLALKTKREPTSSYWLHIVCTVAFHTRR
jgi:hypothetical protein